MTDAGPAQGRTEPRRFAGIRRMSPELYDAADAAETFEGLPEGMTHWDLFWHIDRAAEPMRFTRVEVDTLRTLYRFSQQQDWKRGTRPIVWPSNDTLMLELGLSRTALKYRLRCLAEKGLIAWRDSPTGKRYGLRDDRGDLVLNCTYGIDLSPALAIVEECERAAARFDIEKAERRDLRRRRTIAVKAVRQAIEAAEEYRLEVDLYGARAELASFPDASDPWMPITVLRDLVSAAEELRRGIEGAVKAALENVGTEASGTSERDSLGKEEYLDPTGSIDGPLIQITTESKIKESNTGNAAIRARRRPEGGAKPVASEPSSSAAAGDRPGHGIEYISRSMAMKLMPETMKRFMADTGAASNPRAPNWAEIVNIAYWHLNELGISETAWQQACASIGRNGAAVAVFIIASKHEEIRKPDRYLRSMAYRADTGGLQLHRSVWGILKGGHEHGSA